MPAPAWSAAATALAAALVLTGCAGGAAEQTAADARPPTPSAAAGPVVQGDPAVPVVPADAGHVHGLGINPADGRLYLGTHTGTMVVDDDEVRRVGESTIDLMGFAVAGPDHFFASGHPGPGDELPDPVGLIESTDAGRTWTVRSRAGQSDFHTLTASGTTVYGYDRVVMSTSDGTTWTTGAADLRPASLAVDPEDPRTVLATTERGPVRSTDGGATFRPVPDAPLLVFLAWTAPDALWGVGPDGTVVRSEDGGASWRPTGAVGGPPEAFTADGTDTVAVALARSIVRSTDGGVTFTPVAAKH